MEMNWRGLLISCMYVCLLCDGSTSHFGVIGKIEGVEYDLDVEVDLVVMTFEVLCMRFEERKEDGEKS